MIAPDLSFAIKNQDRYPVIVLNKAVTAFLSAIVPVAGKLNCKTLDTQARYVRINSANILVVEIHHKRQTIQITARLLAYFITHKRFPHEKIALACSCGYYHCVENSHLIKERSGSNEGGIKRNKDRNSRNSGGYKVYTYIEVRTVTRDEDIPEWAKDLENTINVKAERID